MSTNAKEKKIGTTEVQDYTRDTIDISLFQSLEHQLLKNRVIFLEGEITTELATDFMRKLLLLSFDNSNPIKLLISSRGGDVDAGMMIVDAIQSANAQIETYCLDKAYSMAAVVFIAGTGGRYMFPHSTLMLHQPYIKNVTGGTTKHLLELYESMMDRTQDFDLLIANLINRSIQDVEHALSFDHYFTPAEAMDFGMADAITGVDTVLLKSL